MGIEGLNVLSGTTGYDPSSYEREDPEAAAERKAKEVADARQARAERLGHVEKPKKKAAKPKEEAKEPEA
jgi:hypothetical protein